MENSNIKKSTTKTIKVEKELPVAVELKNLEIDFGTVKGVDDLTLKIYEGELVALLGPSGCGKSTTLNAIAGLLNSTGGSIEFFGKDVTKLPPKDRGLGFVFQNYALYPHMTIYNNIRFPLINDKSYQATLKEDKQKWKAQLAESKKAMAAAEKSGATVDQSIKEKFDEATEGLKEVKTRIDRRVKEVADVVKISDQLKKTPGQLSGGQQQRVAIARALAKNAKILLMDEPFSNLDAKLRVETREWIRSIQSKLGITTIFVTHDQEEAMAISDRMIVLDKGRLMQEGKPYDVYKTPDNTFVAQFVGSPQMNMFEGEVKAKKLYYKDVQLCSVKKSKDGKVTFGCRPEHTWMFGKVEPKNYTNKKAVEGTIVGKQQLGREQLLTIKVGEGKFIKAIYAVSEKIKMGSKFPVGFKAKRLYLFDSQDKFTEIV